MAIDVDPVSLRVKGDFGSLDAALASLFPKMAKMDDMVKDLSASFVAQAKAATVTAAQEVRAVQQSVTALEKKAKAQAKTSDDIEKQVLRDLKNAEKAMRDEERLRKQAEVEKKRLAAEEKRRLKEIDKEEALRFKQESERLKVLDQVRRASLSPLERLIDTRERLLTNSTKEIQQTSKFIDTMQKLNLKIDEATKRRDNNAGRNLADFFDALNVTMKGTTGQSKELAEEGLKRLEVAADGVYKKMDALETALDAIGVPFASLFAKGRNLADSFKTMAEQGDIAGIKTLKTSIAIGAVTVAGVAAVAAVAALAAGFVSVTANAAKWNEELKYTGLALDEMAHKKLKDSAASVESVGTSFKALGVSLGAAVGPAVAYMAEGFTGLNLILRDGFSKTLPEYGHQVKELTFKIREQAEAEKRLSEEKQIQDEIIEKWRAHQRADASMRHNMIEQIIQEQAARLKGVDRIKAEGEARLRALEAERIELSKSGKVNAATEATYARLRVEIEQTTQHQIREERKKTWGERVEQMAQERQALAAQAEEQATTLRSLIDAGLKPLELAQREATISTSVLQHAVDQGRITFAEYMTGLIGVENKLRDVRAEQEKTAKAPFTGQTPQPQAYDTTVPALTDGKESTFSKAKRTISAFEEAGKTLAKTFGGVAQSVGMALGSIGSGMFGILDKLTAEATGSGLMDLIKGGPGAGKKLAQGLASIDFKSLFGDIASNVVGVLDVFGNSPEIWSSIASGLAGAVTTLAKNSSAIVGMVTGILTSVVDNIDILIPAFVELGIGLAVGIVTHLPTIISKVVEGVAVAIGKTLQVLAATMVRPFSPALADSIMGIGVTNYEKSAYTGTENASGVGGSATLRAGDYEATSVGAGASYKVSDRYVPPSTSGHSVATAPGDAVYAYSAGGINDPGVIGRQIVSLVGQLLAEFRSVGANIEGLRIEMRQTRGRTNSGPGSVAT